MRRTALFVLTGSLVLAGGSAHAQSWHVNQTIERFRIHAGEAYLRLSGAPAHICWNFGEQFRIDTTTALGRQITATLLAAQLTGRQVTVWYNHSTAPGTGEGTGCNASTSAQLTGIALAP